ncbi:TIGR04211 family SH3 domain-containing protein [uncultured Desulfuromusa sp.]|uniref:TIGR04211 family SH3 domain-containing protein n=1 Tax=uncultured Desulfuromusa sp. TaxID=219183 RepID=UPI002AA937E9|nr:TIGR04211 family SH3 domain-containing protein [uncultured Desulfuromusa sp.]
MKNFLNYILGPLLLVIITSSAYAETGYISDQLIVTVRSGKGNEYKVLETLPTATPVEILEEDKTHVKVITPKGTEGYIQRHYVSKAVPKNIQITQLKNEIETLQQKMQSGQQSLQTSVNDINTYKQQITDLSQQLTQSRKEQERVSLEYKTLLSKSDNVLNLSTENDRLIEENRLLNSELLLLREENQNFHRSNMIQWFLAGGGVLLLGWIMGKFSRKKQRRF